MVRPRAIVLGLIAVHFLLLSCVWLMDQSPYTHFFDIVFFLILTQGALLGFWTVLGKKATMPWRMYLGLAAIVAVLFGYYSVCPTAPQHYAPLFVLQTCLVAVALLAMRITGLRLVHVSDSAVPPSDPFRFSLFDVLSWTAATALILGSLQCLPRGVIRERLSLPVYLTLRELFLAACVPLAGVALASFWLVLGRRWPIRRFLGWVTVIVLGAALVESVDRQRLLFWYALLWTSYAALLTPSLVVVRLAGYRLEWWCQFGGQEKNRTTAEETPKALRANDGDDSSDAARTELR